MFDQTGSLKNVHRGCQWDADERPVVISLLGIHFFSVVLAQIILSQTGVKLVQNETLCSSLGANETNHEFLLKSKAKRSFNESTDHLEMHQRNHAILEKICGYLVQVGAFVLKRFLQLSERALVLFPSLAIIAESFGCDTNFAAGFDHIISLRLCNHRVINDVVFSVSNLKRTQNRSEGHWHPLLLHFLDLLVTFSTQRILCL